MSAIGSVYAIAVLLVYGWTAYWFVWKLPSWIYYLSISEILLNVAYSAITNFFESLVVLSAPLLLAILLPVNMFSDRFVSAGSLLTLQLAGIFFYLSSIPEIEGAFSYIPFLLAAVLFLIAVGVSVAVSRVSLVTNIVEAFADRAKIFLYLTLPVSGLSLIVVLARNLIK